MKKRVQVAGYDSVTVNAGRADAIITVDGGGDMLAAWHVSLYVRESKALRKALKKAERLAADL